ncbi:MAG TPA: glutathione S-transferase C-terminal domain-containing protein [Kofleriaceae bacterium]|nr:glutathione S-transferase C-terminal domain-containing protein [Kofleriaceae bacterium]
MGYLLDGVWHTGWYEPDAQGAFQRPATRFRNQPSDIAAGRYHLYVAWACPWAHRTLITRSLRGLDHAVGVTVVGSLMGDDGWPMRPEDPDPNGGASHLRDVYLRANPHYSGRVTVPVLWDREAKTIVNNESRDVMRIFDVLFAPLARNPLEPSLAPPELVPEIDRVLDAIYHPINNGVYRAGFATSQPAYSAAVREVFAALAEWEAVLGAQQFLCGDRMTEADVALFTTLLRFDLVYFSHFKCNLKRLRDHPNLWRFTRQMYQHPGIRPTCQLDEIKAHYYWSQTAINPTRVIPLGPALEAELAAPI